MLSGQEQPPAAGQSSQRAATLGSQKPGRYLLRRLMQATPVRGPPHCSQKPGDNLLHQPRSGPGQKVTNLIPGLHTLCRLLVHDTPSSQSPWAKPDRCGRLQPVSGPLLSLPKTWRLPPASACPLETPMTCHTHPVHTNYSTFISRSGPLGVR
jgi:hypothetical protein